VNLSTTRDTSIAQVSILNQSFAWMFVGLVLTALSSLFVASNPPLINGLMSNPILFYGLIFAELGLVFYLSLRITKMSFGAAIASFVGYAILNGVTLASIFLAYTATSIASVFFISALVFGGMALYGYTTKKDLTAIGSLALMALIGVIIATIVNIFLKSTALNYVLSYLTVVIFIGLTAYDTQKLKNMHSTSMSQNLGVLGALMLYLDFINIFLSLLRIFGRSR
jgi:FtsH-binding integral membrane protein